MNCPRCHAEIPSDGPAGLCPKCLLSVGLGEPEVVLAANGEPAPPPPTPADLQGFFPQLEILRLVGRGGMGAVYEARQKGLGRSVALKVLAAPPRADATFEERFLREAHALARLGHENIVTVHDAGRAGPHFFLTMEYVDGPNLRQAERAGRIEPSQALALVVQICAALDYAHKNGVVHRDIKPENVLLTREGRVKIVDFGLAKVLGREARGLSLTSASHSMGTPHYMAPEQIERPRDVDHRADIYSLGVVFYELLTGELPLGRFPLPSQKVEIDVRLDDIVIRTLEKEPERRYQAAGEVRTAVQDVATSPGRGAIDGASGPETAGHLEKRARSGSTSRVLAGLAVVAGVVLAAFATIELARNDGPGGAPVAATPEPASGSPVATAPGDERAAMTAKMERFLVGQSDEDLDAYDFWRAFQPLRPQLSSIYDPLARLQAIDLALAMPGIGAGTNLLRRYLHHEAEHTTFLPLAGEDEIAAVRVEGDPAVIAELRRSLRAVLADVFTAPGIQPSHLDWLVQRHMPFFVSPLEIRIARRDDGWTVTEKETGYDDDVSEFDETLPLGFQRVLDRWRANVGAAPAEPELPDYARCASTDGRRGGERAPAPKVAPLWQSAREALAKKGRPIVAAYLRLERIQMSALAAADTDIAHMRIAPFRAERAVLGTALWQILGEHFSAEDVQRLRAGGFESAVLPFGDADYEIVIGGDASGWRASCARAGAGATSTFSQPDLCEPYARLLATHRANY